ncbi:hypothetical protein HPC38_01385 [Pasteurellaceae bacterium HPA106]|uniref:hypothetical protein n=1 Tax=Spirabiliibacterium pneumoniae TaxID=221400 RepID=UPI001AAD56A0|nr:hypothetical protein [Spirabiliibacterium pneumoniae]MBE2895530.1 hypothetical protein [Spirabiliibacterium pneumoniae]
MHKELSENKQSKKTWWLNLGALLTALSMIFIYESLDNMRFFNSFDIHIPRIVLYVACFCLSYLLFYYIRNIGSVSIKVILCFSIPVLIIIVPYILIYSNSFKSNSSNDNYDIFYYSKIFNNPRFNKIENQKKYSNGIIEYRKDEFNNIDLIKSISIGENISKEYNSKLAMVIEVYLLENNSVGGNVQFYLLSPRIGNDMCEKGKDCLIEYKYDNDKVELLRCRSNDIYSSYNKYAKLSLKDDVHSYIGVICDSNKENEHFFEVGSTKKYLHIKFENSNLDSGKMRFKFNMGKKD